MLSICKSVRKIAAGLFIATALIWHLPAVGKSPSNKIIKKVSYKPSPLSFALDLQYVSAKYDKYRLDDNGSRVPGAGHGFFVGLEALPVQSAGKLGVGAAYRFFRKPNIGLGNDRFASLASHSAQFFLSYHLDFSARQILVPMLRLGPSANWYQQTSQTGAARAGTQTFYGFDSSLGLQIRMSSMDRKTARRLDSSIGINDVFLLLEYVRTAPLTDNRNENLSYSGFRAGLRFEM